MPMVQNCCICQEETPSKTCVNEAVIGSPPIKVRELLLQCFGSPEKVDAVVRNTTNNFLCIICETSLNEFYEATQRVSLKRDEFINRIQINSQCSDQMEYFVVIESTNEDSNSPKEQIEENIDGAVEEHYLEYYLEKISGTSDVIMETCDEEFVKVNQPDEIFDDDWSSDGSNKFQDKETAQAESLLSMERVRKTKLRFCWRCDKSFPSNDAFEIHLKLVHTKSKTLNFSCHRCKKRFESKRECNAHISTKHCQSSNLNSKSNTQSGKNRFEKLTCSLCSKTLTTQRAFQRHLTFHHHGGHKCRECGIIFNSNEYLQKHIVLHKNIRNFACPVCDFEFRTAWNLKRHKKLCLGDISRIKPK